MGALIKTRAIEFMQTPDARSRSKRRTALTSIPAVSESLARKAADVAAASLVWTWEEDGVFFIKWLKYII